MRNGYGQLGLAQAVDLAAKAEADPLDRPSDQELDLHVELVEVYRTVDSKGCDQDWDHPLNRAHGNGDGAGAPAVVPVIGPGRTYPYEGWRDWCGVQACPLLEHVPASQPVDEDCE